MASFLTGMLGLDSGKATSKAAGQNVGYLAGLIRRGSNYINTGEQKSGDYLTQAAGQFQPWQQTGTAANSMVANALGLNGAEGNAAATGAFQTSPGYDFNLNQQLQASRARRCGRRDERQRQSADRASGSCVRRRRSGIRQLA